MSRRRNKNGKSIMRLAIATLVLIAFQTITFVQRAFQLGVELRETWTIFLPLNSIHLILYLILPVIYCAIISSYLHPKRIVSPFHGQIGTMSIVIIIAIIRMSTSSGFIPLNLEYVVNLFVSAFVSMCFVIGIGFIQWLIVKWVVQLNLDDVDRVSFFVDGTPKKILKMLGDDFLDFWNLSRKRDMGEIWVLKTEDEANCHVIIEIGQHPDDSDKSILAVVTFQVRSDWIEKSSRARHLRDVVIGDMVRKLGFDFRENLTNTEDVVSKLAYDHVKDLARSKIEISWGFLKRISRFYQAMIGITMLALIIVSLAYFYYHNISTESYLTLTIGFIIGLLIGIGIPLREDIAKRKREELTRT